LYTLCVLTEFHIIHDYDVDDDNYKRGITLVIPFTDSVNNARC